ncbi:D-amino acid aminotransferase [Alteromonas pelagimontana]|uniref:Aminodeoxychorismate lyase n=1 Tax=Alteromonas pelagimontana TaxID=1858656 RepID=A0A6M4M865_9ALTE|nr:D-amino acid aminotransferase [Alteromonas pelagimontana]QJR79424.1 D-amino acid aminotransferase [Alteromonas pelagimontana]
MTIAFLNGDYLPLAEARISPMDRGFLFGDGIYEVIPTLQGKPIGFNAHMARMRQGLEMLEISSPFPADYWRAVVNSLLTKNNELLQSESVGIYIQISRGADATRSHAYPDDLTPTLFAFAFATPPPPVPDASKVKGLHVALGEDKRWQRCNIKSTSLLGNVMHFEQGKREGKQEIILFNRHKEISEASSSNVFIVSNGVIKTPPLDHQILPGITRKLVIECLVKEGILVEETVLPLAELLAAEEVWLTSSSKEIAPVIEIEGKPVGNGKVGKIWQQAIEAFNQHKFNF